MSVGNAILLGLVQGVTEFLPVSSSGHLSILNNLFGMTTARDGHLFFDALLRLGTMIAILLVYWQDVKAMAQETLSLMNLGPLAGRPLSRRPGARLFFLIVLATLPLVLMLPIKDLLNGLYGKNIFIGVALILNGCILYVADRMIPGSKGVGGMTLLDALIIGLCQCVAVIPGLSSAATAITASFATGLKRDFAVKFAFLLLVPAMFGSAVLKLADGLRAGVDWSLFPTYLIGMAAAVISGIVVIQLMTVIARRGKFGGFAYYCWVVGALSIILTMIF